jgi:FtsP/CotA-like multicopper oxidase with cupredoxin domain
MSTHWFHDHMFDHTAENVYKGNAAWMNYYSALDRGNEAIDDGVNLRFPSGTALAWGNRDYDVSMLLTDRAWDGQGQLWFNTLDVSDGFLGDRMLVNWLYKPFFDVRARSYRFRFLNGSVARIMTIALVHQVAGDAGEFPGPPGSNVSYNRVPFHLIANDGNVMEHAISFDGTRELFRRMKPDELKGRLPSLSIAERFDIIIDFSKHGISPGDKLYLVNVREHGNGRKSKGLVDLDEVLSGKYNPVVRGDRWINGDPGVGKFLELRVHPYAGTDLSMNPADFEPGKQKMIPLPIDIDDPADRALLAAARRHHFDFVRTQGGSHTPWQIKVNGGDANIADVRRISAIERGALEIFTIKGHGGWSHPVHFHFEEAIVITRMGEAPPAWERWARKDMFNVGAEEDAGGIVEIAFRARDWLGAYVAHCHNTMHEDHAMLLRWDSMRPGSAMLLDVPMPTWDGVFFEPSFALPLADVGEGIGPDKGFPDD